MLHEHIQRYAKHGHLESDNTLHVVCVISNPIRFQSRYRLFKRFEKEMLETPNVQLYVVEAAFGDRKHECAEAGNPNHLQLRTNQEIWHKENMLNLGVKHLLPANWKYMAAIDADVSFDNPGWALETIQQLQHYPVVQPWSDCIDLGPNNEILRHFESFCKIHRKRVQKQCHPHEPYAYAHTGFAWAYTRYFWENIGGFLDKCILGSADHHMAWGLIGGMDRSVHGKTTDGFKRYCKEWQDRACLVTHGDDVGYVKGHIKHFFHGPKKSRKYRERWCIQIDHDYDPYKDVAYDSQGLLYILSKNKMISDLKDYFRGRNEDSIEV